MSFIKRHSYTASVIVTSDTCSREPTKDTSGAYVVEQLLLYGFKNVNKFIVEDEKNKIIDCLKRNCLVDKNNVLIITVGGTGLCPRDVTPDATSSIYDRHCNGIATSLIVSSLKYSPHAALSRLTAGIKSNCLIVNFPGKLKACKECFSSLSVYLDHALEQVRFEPELIRQTHLRQEEENLLKSMLTKSQPKKDSDDPGSKNNPPEVSKIISQCASISLGKSADVKISPAKHQSSPKETIKMSHLKTVSPYPMVDYDRAISIIYELSGSLCLSETEFVIEPTTMHLAIGQTLAQDLYPKAAIPPYSVSIMDGYLVFIPKAIDKRILASMKVIQANLVANLGELVEKSKSTKSFCCCQINTGGKVLDDMDDFAIVPFENTGPNSSPNLIQINGTLERNKYIRKPGSDLNTKDKLSKGTKIGPVELGAIISMRQTKFKIFRQPIIGIFSTGDELIAFDKLGSDESLDNVVDINGPILTLLTQNRNHSVINFGISKDTPEDILAKLKTCLVICDLVITTGGASMGSKDFVKDTIVDKLKGTIHFGRVNMKPGNPVSAYITMLTLVNPFIEHAFRKNFAPTTQAHLKPYTYIGELITVELCKIYDYDDNLNNSLEYNSDGRLEFVRAKLEPPMILTANGDSILKAQYGVSITIKQQSSCLLSLLDCNCLILIEPNSKNSKLVVGQIYHAIKLTH